LSEIHKELGPVSPRTLYRWTKDFDEGGIDGLVPRYGGIGNTKVTDHEKNFLLTLLLHPHRLKVSYAIALTKEWLKGKGIESPSSPATLRRFADQFKKEHYDLWVLRREGEKALNDKVLPYAERDWRVLDVGDGLVADGHRLNFQVINPNTGKPCRPALILFWDWRSSYPLGWEIMLEENIQCVASALRNAILALGKIPKWVYLDNGKAFKAKIFTEDLDFEDGELPGMFSRLNINYHFAQPYNAQAKPIERIFGILNEQLERLVHSYIGNSIDDKPAWTKRNEKLARSLHGPDKTPTIPEANALIRAWRDRYAEQPSRGRDGLRPIDIFNEGKGSGVDPAELVYLMMAQEIRTVHRNGVTWLGWHWYHEDLYGLKDRVVIRYSLSDLSQIYIFHQSLPNGFCVAEPIEQVNPMASESESPRDMEAVKEVLRLKKKVKSGTCRLSDLLETKAASQIDWSRTRTPEIAETIQKIEDAKKPKAVNISPFVEGVDYSNQPETRPKYKPPRQWDGYYEHWERYNHHLKQDPATITDEDREFIAMYKGTSEYQAIYCTKPTQLLSGGGKIEYRPTIEDPLPEEPNEKSLIVDPRTGLSRPDDGTVYKDEFLYWEWYRSIEEKFPGVLKDTDWAKIEEYQGSPEWEKLYGGRGYARMVRTAGGLSHASLEPKNKEGRI
jgi:putative transposase